MAKISRTLMNLVPNACSSTRCGSVKKTRGPLQEIKPGSQSPGCYTSIVNFWISMLATSQGVYAAIKKDEHQPAVIGLTAKGWIPVRRVQQPRVDPSLGMPKSCECCYSATGVKLVGFSKNHINQTKNLRTILL